MRKVRLLFICMTIGLSFNAYAKTIDISYSGAPVTKSVRLSKGDVVMINTSVDVNTKVLIKVTPVEKVSDHSFTFTSSMEAVSPGRDGAFVDQMYTGANPGWLSYTYTGDNKVEAKFALSP